MTDLYQQYRLGEKDGNAQMVVWLDHTGLKVGTVVTLRATGPRLWVILEAYPGVRTNADALHKPWKVGGLT